MRELKDILGGQIRVGILRALLLAGTHELYERELLQRERLPIGGARRELARLRRLGLILTRKTAKRRFWRANTAHGLYFDLKQLFLKAALFEHDLRTLERLRPKIRVAFVFGSSALGREDEASDLDLAIVGAVTGLELTKLLASPSLRVSRAVNSVRFSEEEIRTKYQSGTAFVREIVDGPKIFLIGRDHDLREIVAREPAAASPADERRR